jgi:hypothetical protein
MLVVRVGGKFTDNLLYLGTGLDAVDVKTQGLVYDAYLPQK